MRKRIFGLTMILCLTVLMGFTGFAVWRSVSARPTFSTGGYVLKENAMEAERLMFQASEPYRVSAGAVKFETTEGEQAVVRKDSFAHLDDDSVFALSDGILLDFNDLSENFINNYYINAGLAIRAAGDVYTIDTDSGTISFGDHLWKLSEQRYLIRSSVLRVYFSEADQREVEDYVLVNITEDGIAQLLTEENIWMTISEECYIETASGVKIHPISQLVDNGTYKMSLAKLSVNPDDKIMLTEDETRRQIVPELNINAVDGEDGLDGEEGMQGETGEDGEEGETGDEGEEGEDGQGGTTGSNGQGGAAGAPGQQGNNALVDSSTNSALPVMTFTDWEVGTTSLRGIISVTDEAGFLSELGGKEAYPATVKIYHVATGEEIFCYEIEEGVSFEQVDLGNYSSAFEGLNSGAEEVYFASRSDALEPDTEYRISVSAYYMANETIYSREFISRVFYTDSMGVILTDEPAGEDYVTVGVSVGEVYQESVRNVEVILLTPQQNQSFTLANKDDASKYTYKYQLNYDSKAARLFNTNGEQVTEGTLSGITYEQELQFPNLPSDTRYIARVFVDTDSVDALTSQELSVSTLKQAPTWDGVPRATYNRVTGSFEVNRPIVQDPDGGAVRYIYTAYDIDGNVLTTRTLAVGESEPAIFYLPTGESYTFGVTMEFDDNEKDVSYELGRSVPVLAQGSTLPKLTLDIASKDYDTMTGKIAIHLTDQDTSPLFVDPQNPLELNVYADQIYQETIVIKNAGDANAVTGYAPDNATLLYTAVLENSSNNNAVTNYPEIDLSLYHLYKNTNYTITVTGSLDLGDGNGAVRRTLGTVSFATYDTLPLKVTMKGTDAGTSIAMSLQISPQDDSGNGERNAYAMKQLQEGQVTLQLYSGVGYGATLLATANINDAVRLEEVYGSGMDINEDLFGNPTLDPNGDYMLRVSGVTDETYQMGLNYINSFDSLKNSTAVLVTAKTPPNLLINPAEGVTAEPIYNVDAALYGAVYDKNMPDDAIIGYTLAANYDNSQRIAKYVKYYAFEYREFYNAVINASNNSPDPLTVATDLLELQPLEVGDTDDVPKVAVLFGGDRSTPAAYYNGYQVFYAGEVDALDDGVLRRGMGRGYRYLFAYTVTYSPTGTEEETQYRTYPQDHDRYYDYMTAYGIGQEYGKTIGAGRSYVLNSGMCEAPKITPEFYTYVNEVKNVQLINESSPSTGEMEIHYAWSDDLDSVISTGADKSQIVYEVANGVKNSVDIDHERVAGAATVNWYTITIPYTAPQTSEDPVLVKPVVDLDIYELDYTNLLSILRRDTIYEKQDDNTYLCQVPVEWAWGSFVEAKAKDIQIHLNTDEEYLKNNQVRLELTELVVGSNVWSMIVPRACALKVTATAGNNSKNIYLPIQYNDIGGNYYAILSTALLGTEFLNRDITIETEILYDTGSQGWALAENDNSESGFIALQMSNDSQGVPGFSSYFVYSSTTGHTTTSGSPSGGLSKITTANIRRTMQALYDKPEESANVGFENWGLTRKESSHSRYFRPTHHGIDGSTSSIHASGRIFSIKEVGSTSVTVQNDSGGDTVFLETITPTVEYGGYTPASRSILALASGILGRDGLSDEYDKNTVYLALYDSKEAAAELGEPTAGPLAVSVDAGDMMPGTEITGLLEDTVYYLIYYMESNDEQRILLDAGTADKAIYPVKTSKKVTFTSQEGLVYTNTSYLDKYLNLEFTVSRNYGVKVRFDFYSDAAAAGMPLLTQEDMISTHMMEELKELSHLSNHLQIEMMPSQARAKLAPGGNYYLKATALETLEEDGEQTEVEVGTHIFPVMIPAVGNYGAQIYVSTATSAFINYQVTINDGQYSFMASNNYDLGEDSLLSGAGLYAVRFTGTKEDEAGNQIEYRLKTKYDDYVYSANELRKGFVLRNENLSLYPNQKEGGQEIVSGNTYTMHIYAVVDEQHIGESKAIGQDGDGKDIVKNWEYFFKDLSDKTLKVTNMNGKVEEKPVKVSAVFRDLIDSFWLDGDYPNDPTMDSIEQNFLVATKTQTVPDADSVLLNKEAAILTRSSSTEFRLLLPESFGIISDEGEQAYEKIQWDITGTTTEGTAVHYSGTSLEKEGDSMFMTSDNTSYKFYYDLKQTVPSGSYTIVIQLYKTEDAGPETLSFTYYG